MAEYKVTKSDGTVGTVTAARFTRDGSGTTFYDENGEQLLFFYDGQIRNVEDTSAIVWETTAEEASE